MKKFDLQMFANPVSGKKIVYLFRVLDSATTDDAVAMAFTTENSNTISKDADSTVTKDGTIRTPGGAEIEITATALLAQGDKLYDKLKAAMIADKLVEVWEANLDEPAVGGNNKFKGMYYQGYLTEFEKTSNAEDYVECSTTFAINGTGASGDVTVTTAQQEVAAYVFADTQKTGA
jgi:TP901-1 family phage major tail protein